MVAGNATLGADLLEDLGAFDTANTCGGGSGETVLGARLKDLGSGFRSRIEMATKVGDPNGCPEGERPLSRAQVAFHLDESLSRLGIDRIDLYYLHGFDPLTPLEETLEALKAGKIAKFGVSNAMAADLTTVLVLIIGALRAAFTHVQNGFNRLETADLAEVIPLSQAEGLRYVVFSPLAGGLLPENTLSARRPVRERDSATLRGSMTTCSHPPASRPSGG